MRLWCLHVDGCRFAAETPRPEVDATDTERAAGANTAVEDPTAASGEGAIDEGVVALVGVERRDETALRRGDTTAAGLASAASERIRDAATDLGESAVVVLPAPALAPEPAEEALPTTVFKQFDEELDHEDSEYLRAPVGWHLAVEIDARGHPYASRVDEVTGARAGAPATDWQVVADGSVTSVAAADLSTPVQRYLDRRRSGEADGESDLAPAREAGLVAGDEQATLTPAGTLVRDLLSEHLAARLRAAGARPVGAAPGQASRRDSPFDAVETLSAADLPASLYALDGEGERRGPEAWTAVADHPAATDALETQVALLGRWLCDASLDFVLLIVAPADCGAATTERLQSIADVVDGPALLECPSGDAPLGVELVVTDATGKPLATARVRLLDGGQAGDSAEYVVHATLAPPEEFVLALCSQSASDQRLLQTWLAPTQVRLVPLEPAAHRARCQALADGLEGAGVRVDIDDRSLAVGERFAAAAAAGVPHVSLVGDGEQSGETIPVTDRDARTEREWPTEELAAVVTGAADGYPRSDRSQPRLLAERLFGAGGTGE